jgi:hypothetical protein
MLIRNVKSKMDLAKKLREQKENLRIEIANDNNIATARKNARFGIMPEVEPAQIMSQAEVANDDNSTMSRARDYLLTMFLPNKVRNILNLLSTSKQKILNIYWNDFKQRLERVDTQLITPDDFNQYFSKYINDVLSQKGLGEVSAVNEPEELQNIIPSKEFIQQIAKDTPELKEELEEFSTFLPDKNIIDKLQSLSEADQEQFVGTLMEAYKDIGSIEDWRNELRKGKNYRKLFQNLNEDQKNMIEVILDSILDEPPVEIEEDQEAYLRMIGAMGGLADKQYEDEEATTPLSTLAAQMAMIESSKTKDDVSGISASTASTAPPARFSPKDLTPLEPTEVEESFTEPSPRRDPDIPLPWEEVFILGQDKEVQDDQIKSWAQKIKNSGLEAERKMYLEAFEGSIRSATLAKRIEAADKNLEKILEASEYETIRKDFTDKYGKQVFMKAINENQFTKKELNPMVEALEEAAAEFPEMYNQSNELTGQQIQELINLFELKYNKKPFDKKRYENLLEKYAIIADDMRFLKIREITEKRIGKKPEKKIGKPDKTKSKSAVTEAKSAIADMGRAVRRSSLDKIPTAKPAPPKRPKPSTPKVSRRADGEPETPSLYKAAPPKDPRISINPADQRSFTSSLSRPTLAERQTAKAKEIPKKVPARSASATERAKKGVSSAVKGTANLLGLRTPSRARSLSRDDVEPSYSIDDIMYEPKTLKKKTPQDRKEASTKGVAAFMSKTQGKGIKKGRGMRTITDKVLEPISRWIQVGKLKYNNRLLDEKQMFSVKYPSGAVNPHFAKNVAVSDLFYELMKNLEKSQKVDTRILKELDPDEKKLFENFIVRSGTGRQFNIMDVSPTDEEAEKEKRMTIVKGSYLAGNNSPEVINELRSLILYFIGINRIDKKQGLATLQSIV